MFWCSALDPQRSGFPWRCTTRTRAPGSFPSHGFHQMRQPPLHCAMPHPVFFSVAPAAELENLKSRNPDMRIVVAAHISYAEFVQLLRSTKIFISPLGCESASPFAFAFPSPRSFFTLPWHSSARLVRPLRPAQICFCPFSCARSHAPNSSGNLQSGTGLRLLSEPVCLAV